MLASLIDRALDASVVGGYTRAGYRLRSAAWDALPGMEDRRVLVTGATSGIGRAAAEGFAALGAQVLILARDRAKGERVAAEIGAADVVVGDLASLQSVRRAAKAVAAGGPLDVLVNNAGAMMAERELSVDGVELTFATNVLGTFVLTQALEAARVVTVSSGGMYAQKRDVDDLQTARRDYDAAAVYARTKRAQVVLTQEWARRGRIAHAMHPGWVDTPGVARTSADDAARLWSALTQLSA